MKKLFLFILLGALAIPTLVFAQPPAYNRPGSFGIFGTNTSPSVQDSLIGAAAADTLTGRVITLEPAIRYNGNLTLVVDTNRESGTLTTITVEARHYWPDFDANQSASLDSVEFGNWFTVGTITAENAYLNEFNLSSLTEWYFATGYQIRFRAASGTYNVDLIARTYIR